MSAKVINFLQRRNLLCEQLMDESVVVVSSSSIKTRNSDSDYPFRQDSNFFYLSGFNEPESVIVLRPFALDRKYVIFCRFLQRV